VVAGREVNVVGGITAAGGAHIPGIEGVFEAENHAVHRHGFQVGVAAISVVEFGGALQGIGEVPEMLTDRRSAGGQRSERGMTVVVSPAGDGTLAPDVQGCEGVELPGVRDADNHAELL